MLHAIVSCFTQPMLDPTGAGSFEGTWVRGGCRIATAGHAGRDGRLPGNTRFTYSLHMPSWTMVLTFALCLSECAVTAIAEGASFEPDVTCKHESASTQLLSMACEQMQYCVCWCGPGSHHALKLHSLALGQKQAAGLTLCTKPLYRAASCQRDCCLAGSM